MLLCRDLTSLHGGEDRVAFNVRRATREVLAAMEKCTQSVGADKHREERRNHDRRGCMILVSVPRAGKVPRFHASVARPQHSVGGALAAMATLLILLWETSEAALRSPGVRS